MTPATSAGPGGGGAASAAAAPRATARSSRSTSGAWSPGRHRSLRPVRAATPASPAAAPRPGSAPRTSRRTACCPGRTSGSRSLARSVLSSLEREVLGEPAGHLAAVDHLRGPAVRELRVVGHVGGAADLVLVPGDQDAVLGRDQVGLDVVGALPDRERGTTRACARAGSRRRRGGRSRGAPVVWWCRRGRLVAAGRRARRARRTGVRVTVMSAPPASKRVIEGSPGRHVLDGSALEMTDRPPGGEGQMTMMGT